MTLIDLRNFFACFQQYLNLKANDSIEKCAAQYRDSAVIHTEFSKTQ
jgi:hypothetical protein